MYTCPRVVQIHVVQGADWTTDDQEVSVSQCNVPTAQLPKSSTARARQAPLLRSHRLLTALLPEVTTVQSPSLSLSSVSHLTAL